MYKHILIPVDGSTISNKAAKAGVALAKSLGAKITVYAAMESMQPIYAEGYAFDEKMLEAIESSARALAQKHVDAVVRIARAASVPCAALVTRPGTTHDGIIKAAKKQKCDLIFMASHGRSGLAKFIMGSVTQKVLAHVRLPVLVYR